MFFPDGVPAEVRSNSRARKATGVKLGVYARSLRLPMTDAEMRQHAKALRRELRGKVDADDADGEPNENGCECGCEACAGDLCFDCTEPDCDDPDCKDCRNQERSRLIAGHGQGRTIYPGNGLDPVSAFEAVEAERKIAHARWLAARDVPRY